ncbi:hypothetical protein HK100_010149 [Physocladia obscura]|uniref:Uncharacterized protein n=1 Tax=Physocladia obscura TaxID=109957 RepID=A0AAD5T5G2_9FUNG|nr:hypothetical protein HK100_010149 [Physocladia obscura]
MGKRNDNESDNDNIERKHKHKSKKTKKDKKLSKDFDSEDSDSPVVSNPITSDHFYEKSAEFIVWLREKKKLFLSNLLSEESHELFSKFVKKWNRGSLDPKFYAGISTTDVNSNERSKHRWNFKVSRDDEVKLEEAKDSIHFMTTSKDGLELGLSSKDKDKEKTDSKSWGPSPAGPSVAPRSRNMNMSRKDEDMDDEDRARYHAALKKKEIKSFESKRKEDLEELVPKATGREAQLEKKKSINSFHKQERDTEIAFKESDLMGGGDSFKDLLAREKLRKERYEQRRNLPQQRDQFDSRVQDFKAREDATIAMLRDLAKANGKI